MGVRAALVALGFLLSVADGIPLRHDLGNMSMSIDTSSPVAQSYFNQGLRFSSTFKFDYSVQSHIAALHADPDCAMCEWGLAVAYGQNLNDALVLSLEPWFLDNEPLAYEAVRRAQTLLSSQEKPAYAGSERDAALVAALALKYVATVDEYESYFVDGLPASLNLAYAEAMAGAAVRSGEEGWPDHPMVLLLAADAWMNTSPWDYWENPQEMKPHAQKARLLLEDAMARDPANPWAIHLFTHLMEAGGEAEAAVAPAQKLQYLVPGAPHLQHMQSHVEFRIGEWHEASEANIRAVALPDSDATYPDHNMDMLMWALGVEGRRKASKAIGERLTAYSAPRVASGVLAPLLPPERYLSQEALHLSAFADWEGVLALDAPPEGADFSTAVYHYARSLAFVDAEDWDSYRREQGLILAGVERMKERTAYYGVYNVCALTKILNLLSRAEGLRGGIPDSPDDGSARRRGLLRTGASLSAPAPGTETDDQGPRLPVGRELTLTAQTIGASRAAAPLDDCYDTGGSRQEELDLLRQAVQMEDALGYDEPPGLPVSPRLFLAAALLRGCGSSGGGSDSGEGGVSKTTRADIELTRVRKDEAEEAEAVLHVLDTKYPNMGRTLLGLWRASTALGKHDEALELRERFIDSWQHAEVWLVDSAHVGVGERPESAGSAQGGSESVGVAAERDLDLGGGDGKDTDSPDSASVAVASLEQEQEEDEEEVKGQNTIVTAATATTATIVLAAALSLAVAVVVAVRRRSRARGVACGGLNEMPWELHSVSAEMEEVNNAEQPRDPQRWGPGVRKNWYSSITAV